MKAISLWQPWASLLVLGLKRFETRTFPFPAALRGQRVAIHASKKDVPMLPQFGIAVCDYLSRSAVDPKSLALGAIVGTVVLQEPFQIGARIPGTSRETWDLGQLLFRLCPDFVDRNTEASLGDFRMDRWAWECTNPRRLATPIPFKGMQGFFALPFEVVAEINRQHDEAAGLAADAAFGPLAAAMEEVPEQ